MIKFLDLVVAPWPTPDSGEMEHPAIVIGISKGIVGTNVVMSAALDGKAFYDTGLHVPTRFSVNQGRILRVPAAWVKRYGQVIGALATDSPAERRLEKALKRWVRTTMP